MSAAPQPHEQPCDGSGSMLFLLTGTLMSDSAAPRAETPFATTPAAEPVDALAGDWSAGLRGPVKDSGLVAPHHLGFGPSPLPASTRSALPRPDAPSDELRTEEADLHALLELKDKLLGEAPKLLLAPKAHEKAAAEKDPEVAAPEGWASAEEDQLASSPPPPRTDPVPAIPAPAGAQELPAAPPDVSWEAPATALQGWGAAMPAEQAWGEASWGAPAAMPAVPFIDPWAVSDQALLPPAASDESPVELDDPDLLVPVVEPEGPVPTGPLVMLGEHRVAITTRAGRTRRGILRDVDLAALDFKLYPANGGGFERVRSDEVKVIFFMLPPGEKPLVPAGMKVKVKFAADGRCIEGNRDGEDAPSGFFLVPMDAAKTNTRRIFVAREALSEVVG